MRASIARNRRSASPRSPTDPGTGSQSSPRAATARTTRSCRGMSLLPHEDVGDPRDRAEVVEPDVGVRDLAADLSLRPGDELEDLDGADDAGGEERRVRADHDAGRSETLRDPGEHAL